MIGRFGYWRLVDAQETSHAWRVRELSTGSIILVVSDSPMRPTEGWRGNRERLEEYLSIPR